MCIRIVRAELFCFLGLDCLEKTPRIQGMPMVVYCRCFLFFENVIDISFDLIEAMSDLIFLHNLFDFCGRIVVRSSEVDDEPRRCRVHFAHSPNIELCTAYFDKRLSRYEVSAAASGFRSCVRSSHSVCFPWFHLGLNIIFLLLNISFTGNV